MQPSLQTLVVLAFAAWLVLGRGDGGQRRSNPRRRNPATRWHAYRDSEAPGVRRQSIGREPDYSTSNLRQALEWAARAQWGAMRIDLPRGGEKGSAAAERELEAFRQHAEDLGYRLTHIRYGRGDRTWRFRVELAERPTQLRLFNPRGFQQNPKFVQTSTQPEKSVNAEREGCRCGSGASCRPNPYTTACRIGPGHVWDFRHGGRCGCCGRMAPRRLVTLEWERSGERTHYGRTCASRAIGTTKLRTNQRAHQEQEQQARAALARRYRGVSSERGHGLDVVRPPWAVGISNQQLVRMARDVGQNAGQDLWWERAGLYSGMGELRELLREGGYREEKGRKGTAAARAARELRLEHRGSGRQSASERTRARRTAVASAGGSDLPW